MVRQKLYSIARFWHTVRYLRPVQIYGRVWFRLYRPAVDLRSTPDLRVAEADWITPVACPCVMTKADEFCFLNKQGRVSNRADWNNPDQDKLWLYNLHYFDDLKSNNAQNRKDWHKNLIGRWITENPPVQGNGWEPYPLSLRIVNWVKWELAGNGLKPEWQQSLAVQIRHLANRLEWHLLGNHLFVNAKALIFAGLFFEGKEAENWLKKGLSILAREIPEQILPDGGHFELSPMYHAIILEDILDLINLSNRYPDQIAPDTVKSWHETTKRMRRWLLVMCHPDEQISFFNDAAFGIAPKPDMLESYAQRLGLSACKQPEMGLTYLQDSGYIRVQQDDMVALLDVAKIGSDYIPGHAHADTLCFELSLYQQRVITNSGISQYGTSPERLFQRSTQSHNTVEINDENSSEVWSGFRVARRAKPLNLEIKEKEGVIIIRCSHNGYHRLKNPVTHKREWHFQKRSLNIIDIITGQYDKAVAHYYFHPEIKETKKTGQFGLLDDKTLNWEGTGCTSQIDLATWYPEFGKSVPTRCLTAQLSEAQSIMTLTW